MSWKGDLLKAGIDSNGVDVEVFKGSLTAGNIIGRQGKTIYVDPTSGDDDNDGRSPAQAVSTIAEGEDRLTAGQNDTLVYLAGTTSGSIVDTLTWDKDYTHFIGMCAPTFMAQRARIFNSGNTTASTPLLNVTAKGCLFKDLYLFQGSAVATVGCVQVSGGRNAFVNVHFAGMGHATNSAGANAYSLKLNGAEECLFKNCTIGIDTIKRTGDNHPLWIDGTVTRCKFDECMFVSWAENTGYSLCTVQDTTAIDRFIQFHNCTYYNFWTNWGNTLAEAFAVPAGMQTNYLMFTGQQNLIAIDELESNDRSGTYVTGPAAAAASGIGVTPTT